MIWKKNLFIHLCKQKKKGMKGFMHMQMHCITGQSSSIPFEKET